MKNRDKSGRTANRRGGRFDDRGSKQMHQAICADCGDRCEVPFKPRGDRPIYCSSCLDKHRSRDDRRGGGSFRDRGDRPMFRATCDNCGKQCEVPFRPTGDKPVYCSDCFGDKGSRTGRNKQSGSVNGEIMAQMKAMQAKLDKILQVIAPPTVHEVPLKKEPVSKIAISKTVKKAGKANKTTKKSTKHAKKKMSKKSKK